MGHLNRTVTRRAVMLGVYAAAVVLVPLEVSRRAPPSRGDVESALVGSAAVTPRPDDAHLRVLQGLWWRYEPGGQGQRVRFYYFHGDGTGLYRYGRVGLTNTHSFDYDIQAGRLILDFRKTGDHYDVAFTMRRGGEGSNPRDWLEFADDPREPGSTRYFRESDAIVRAEPPAELGPGPAGHMWIDLQHNATGGKGFSMYQFRPAGIDGRGVGWFHRGDFDEWSTEAMTYRIVGHRLELDFSLAETRASSSFVLTRDPQGDRWLQLDDDPRDYWHSHRYIDMGPSFGAALAPWAIATRLKRR